jgi:hypothetical protein
MSWRFNGDPVLNFNANNPFLDVLAAIDEPAGAAGGQPEQPPAAVAESSSGRVKLPEFWPHAPGIWFARADLRFEVSKVTSERERFAYTVDALPYESLCLVADMVEAPPADQPYSRLKDRLLIAHQLTPVQKAIKLMEMPSLGDRRPSQMLADLLQACPQNEHASAFFRGAFIMRLPADIQIHLTNTETEDLKQLALLADRLWLSHRRPNTVSAVAAEESGVESELLAAVKGKLNIKKKKKKLITYCFLHHKYGKDARKCENPESCMWAEN